MWKYPWAICHYSTKCTLEKLELKIKVMFALHLAQTTQNEVTDKCHSVRIWQWLIALNTSNAIHSNKHVRMCVSYW